MHRNEIVLVRKFVHDDRQAKSDPHGRMRVLCLALDPKLDHGGGVFPLCLGEGDHDVSSSPSSINAGGVGRMTVVRREQGLGTWDYLMDKKE